MDFVSLEMNADSIRPGEQIKDVGIILKVEEPESVGAVDFAPLIRAGPAGQFGLKRLRQPVFQS